MISTYQRHKTTQVASWDGRLYKLSQAASQEEKSTAIPEIIIYVLSNLFVGEDDIHNFRVLLMENKETVDNFAWYGWTALHYAVQRGESAVCHALLGRGANVHAIDTAGYSPLHYAGMFGRTDLVPMLLRAGSDRFFKNREGNTPIDLAAIFGNEKTVAAMQKGVDLHEEVMYRARRWYTKLFLGSKDHHGIKTSVFYTGQLLAFVLLHDPNFFKTGKGSHMKLLELDSLDEVGFRAFGGLWKDMVDQWPYSFKQKAKARRWWGKVAHIIFNDLITEEEVGRYLKTGERRFKQFKMGINKTMTHMCDAVDWCDGFRPHKLSPQFCGNCGYSYIRHCMKKSMVQGKDVNKQYDILALKRSFDQFDADGGGRWVP